VKTDPEVLVAEIADNFNSYLKKGVQIEPVIEDLDPNLNIDDIEKLLRVHFILTEAEDKGEVGVIDFVRDLQDEVRQVKTTVKRNNVFLENEVRGKIDWQQTIKERYRSASPGMGYSCTQTQENYNIDENLVLKQLLSVIHETVFETLEPAIEDPEDYEWFEPWIDAEKTGEESLSEIVDEVFKDNIYLERIEVRDYDVTDRMIESVKDSRNSLYREAAVLLDRYRRLTRKDLDVDEAKAILENTFVRPEETYTLFELYWIFKILGEYENARFRIIDEDNSSLVAHWENEGYRYKLYHDSTGDMTFHQGIDDAGEPDSDGYLNRMIETTKQDVELQNEILDRDPSDKLWGGFPDILIEKYEKENGLSDLFIGEVKYKRGNDKVADGLRELLEYMAFVEDDDRYVEDSLFDYDSVTGMLFVDDAEISDHDNEGIDVVSHGNEIETDRLP
jgi:hypothetical protein